MTFRLTRLNIRRFQNISPDTIVEFGEGINVILGKNGSGKSTLLTIIANIFLDDPLYGGSWIEADYVSENASFSIEREEVIVEESAGDGDSGLFALNDLTGAKIKKKTNRRLRLSFGYEGRVFSAEAQSGAAKFIIDGREDPGEDRDGEGEVHGFLNLLLYSYRHIRRRDDFPKKLSGIVFRVINFTFGQIVLDEGLDVYHSIFQSSEVSRGSVRVPKPNVSIKYTKEKSTPVDYEMVPWDIVEKLINLHLSDKIEERLLFERFSDADFCAIARRLLEAKLVDIYFIATKTNSGPSGSATPATSVSWGSPYVNVTFHDGFSRINENLSYGQKRLLALAYVLSVGNSPALSSRQTLFADEIVNGLHYSMIESVISEISCQKLQAILTSQSPLLFDRLSFSDKSDLNKRVIVCAREPLSESDQRKECPVSFSVRNLTEVESGEVFEAISLGYEKVSEVFQNRGFW